MEVFYICISIVCIVLIAINYILDRKIQKLIDDLLDENWDLTIRNIDLMKAERDIKNILDYAEETHEFAVETLKKIKSILSDNRKLTK